MDILGLKRKGKYFAPDYDTRPGLIGLVDGEEFTKSLRSLEGTFYSDEKKYVDYFRFYSDKTVIHAVVSKPVFPLDKILVWFDKEHAEVSKGEYKIILLKLADQINRAAGPLGKKLNPRISFSVTHPRQRVEFKFSGEIISRNEIKLEQKIYVRL